VPTITIRNGTRTLKLTKRERNVLIEAGKVAADIEQDYAELRETANYATTGLSGILEFLDKPPANGKPSPAAE
jgi:hypothetical protein